MTQDYHQYLCLQIHIDSILGYYHKICTHVIWTLTIKKVWYHYISPASWGYARGGQMTYVQILRWIPKSKYIICDVTYDITSMWDVDMKAVQHMNTGLPIWDLGVQFGSFWWSKRQWKCNFWYLLQCFAVSHRLVGDLATWKEGSFCDIFWQPWIQLCNWDT